MKVLASIQRFLNDEEGASGIEYAMIAGMVAVVLASSSDSIRSSVKSIFGFGRGARFSVERRLPRLSFSVFVLRGIII